MQLVRKIVIGIIVLIFLFGISNINIIFAREKLPAPIIISPNESTITGKVKPRVTGLTKSGTIVHVYIDGKYDGKTEKVEHFSGTANFSYDPFLNLDVGEHEVWTVAEDENGKKSEPSKISKFSIELPFPAPTLFAPVVNNKTVGQKPFIVGLAKNNSVIRVFIDHRFYGEFKVKNHESGTADFAYLPFLALTAGPHLVYTTAIDERGKESSWSNVVYFSVGPARAPKISAAAEKNEEDETAVLGEEFAPAGEEGAAADEAIIGGFGEVEALWQGKQTEKNIAGGITDESRERQGKLSPNLVIFLLFLGAVIGWIFWVNREIIAEARARDTGEKGKQDEKT